MNWLKEDRETIAAIATPPGEGGVGMIRISGRDARTIAADCFVPQGAAHKQPEAWRSHRMMFGHIVDEAEQYLDEVLLVWMAEGRSYTGEEVIEIHGHGGQLNMLQLLRRVTEAGARFAGPGEFTRRAFLNGRIDLTRAEAIVDLISAKNEQALRIARHHLQGRLKDRLVQLADTSLMLAAQVETWIDFPEEFDPAESNDVASLFGKLEAFTDEVSSLLESYARGRQLQEGWSLLLLGRPNAGKSSLFNRLHGEDKAIVTAVPGTTRDLLDTQMALGGITFTLTDTAGVRELPTAQTEVAPESAAAHHAIEKIGVERALNAAEKAHLVLAVFDLSRPFSEEDQQVLAACEDRPTALVFNKSDLPTQLDLGHFEAFPAVFTATVSCANEDGLSGLTEALQGYMEAQTPAEMLVITNERQRDALARALDALHHAQQEGVALGPEFMAEDLRQARDALAAITGQVSSEEILGAIFTRFCIGK